MLPNALPGPWLPPPSPPLRWGSPSSSLPPEGTRLGLGWDRGPVAPQPGGEVLVPAASQAGLSAHLAQTATLSPVRGTVELSQEGQSRRVCQPTGSSRGGALALSLPGPPELGAWYCRGLSERPCGCPPTHGTVPRPWTRLPGPLSVSTAAHRTRDQLCGAGSTSRPPPSPGTSLPLPAPRPPPPRSPGHPRSPPGSCVATEALPAGH